PRLRTPPSSHLFPYTTLFRSIALFNAIIGAFQPGLTLEEIFGHVFSPVAYLMGVDPADTDKVGSLLGIKLAANEHVAYLSLTKRSEEHTSELQSLAYLVCRLL